MKLKFVYTFFGLTLLAMILLSNANGRAFAKMAGNTGAPGDQKQGNGQPWTCKTCHTSNAFAASVAVAVSDANGNQVSAYTPGEVYDVRVTVSHNGSAAEFGFQALTLLDNGNAAYNAWSAPAINVRLAVVDTSARQYAEQNGPSTSNVFDVKWTAPPPGSGSVTIYAAGNATNNNNMSSGDNAATTTLTLTESMGSSTNTPYEDGFACFINENPAQDELRVTLLSEMAARYQINIRDLQGKILVSDNIISGSGQLNRTIDISRLRTGIYLAEVSDSQQVKVLKFLKM